MEEKNFQEQLEQYTQPFPISSFNPRTVKVSVLNQLILAHQMKYTETLMQAEEENKLVKENAHDFSLYPREVQEAAFGHAEKAKYDQDYFTRNKIDKDLIKPIQILNVIDIKKDEAKTKEWKVLYYARLVERLREFRRMVIKERALNLISRLKFWKRYV